MKYIISDNSIFCNNFKPQYEKWDDASNEKFMQYYLGGISRLIWFNVVHRLRVMTRQLDQVWEDAKTQNYEKYGLHSIKKCIRLLTRENALATSEKR